MQINDTTISNEKYRIIKEIGNGSYGKVFQGERVADKVLVAIKIIKSNKEVRENEMFDKLTEFKNIVKKITSVSCNQIYDGTEYVYEAMVLEYFPYNLRNYMASYRDPFYSISITVSRVLSQVLNGIHYLHSNHIAHRNLNPDNILIDDNFAVKICDFKMAKKILANQEQELNISCPGYLAPEVLIQYKFYDESVDIWSIGCIMVEMFIGSKIIQSIEKKDQLAEIFELCGPFSSDFLQRVAQRQKITLNKQPKSHRHLKEYLESFITYDVIINLINEMLQMDPKKRINAKQAISHDFFQLIEDDFND